MGFINGLFTLSVYLLAPFFFMCMVFYLYFRLFKKMKPIKGEYKNIGHGWKIKRLLWDLPKMMMYDRLSRDPDAFRDYGVHMVAGKQGSGKTVTVAYLLWRYQKMYPKLQVKTNFEYKHQDGEINHWKDIIGTKNGIYGQVIVIDELQNWFNSLASKDFPIEMMYEITQCRKERRCIIGTSQVFERVAKPIREQTYMIHQPYTFFGCLTFVLKFEPKIKASDGNVDKKKFRGVFFFVHSKELRDSFDTYHKIEKMCEGGFKPTEQHISSQSVVIKLPDKKGLFKQ